MDPIYEGLILIGIMLVVAVAASVATYARMKPPPHSLPKLNIGAPVAFEVDRFMGPEPVACRREFVPTHITHGPGGTFVEMQDRESYERERRLPWLE